MKRKLLSVVAIAMAMSMTTSAFAATPRGTGDVDGSEGVTSNDVSMILNGLANDNPEANVDGSADGVDPADAYLLFQQILQPKTVSEDLTLRVYTEGYDEEVAPKNLITSAEDLGSSVGFDAHGTGTVDDSVTVGSGISIKEAIDRYLDSALSNVTSSQLEKINNQLNRISFVNDAGEDVSLRSEKGWARLCWALQPIIPLSLEDAKATNKEDDADFTDISELNEAQQAQVNALNAIKGIIVTDNEDAITPETDLKTMVDNLLIAFPDSITADQVRATAARISDITGQKYTFTAEYNGLSEEISAEAVTDDEGNVTSYNCSPFVELVANNATGYQEMTLGTLRSLFGDKVTLSSSNSNTDADPISVTVEIAVTASQVTE